MSTKRSISTPNAPPPIGPYSQAIVVDEAMIFTSGQIPVDPRTGNVVAGGIAEQTRQVLENLDAVLKAGGSSSDRVVKATVFLKDMTDFGAVNEVYAEYFSGETPPARSAVEVARLPKGVKIEIEAVGLLAG